MSLPSGIFLKVNKLTAHKSRYGGRQMDERVTQFFTLGRFPDHYKRFVFSHRYYNTYLTCRAIVIVSLIIHEDAQCTPQHETCMDLHQDSYYKNWKLLNLFFTGVQARNPAILLGYSACPTTEKMNKQIVDNGNQVSD